MTSTLATVVNYLEADLETARLEGSRLDANTRSVTELERRVAELERAGELELRRRKARGDRRLLEAIERAADPIETEHARHVAELLNCTHFRVVALLEHPAIVGTFVRAEHGIIFYRDLEGRASRTAAGGVAIVNRAEAEAIVAGRRAR
jgi:hypothetical protein